ncbi:hypothetical protein SAMN05421823_101602 [Catalinimonas alkaloidigena]|uniref:Uncharacterized protein n=1 Tax=Catalinimonas alkaloidigena TaxID=1075417 RepID=A0A1G8Y970_9BACT|nr:hypothetical protein [Catalinimonas alkaloidigena]SDJ99223.1 hypothetical protein SAMN05421823_101602 [Catalinimonas alkaloidigena]
MKVLLLFLWGFLSATARGSTPGIGHGDADVLWLALLFCALLALVYGALVAGRWLRRHALHWWHRLHAPERPDTPS